MEPNLLRAASVPARPVPAPITNATPSPIRAAGQFGNTLRVIPNTAKVITPNDKDVAINPRLMLASSNPSPS